MGREKERSSSRVLPGLIQQVCLFVVALLFISGCQHLNMERKAPVSPVEPVEIKKDIAEEFSSAIDCFLKGYFLCNNGAQHKAFLKPFGSNYYDMPYLGSYLRELCYNKVKFNDCIKFVPTIKSHPRFIIESHIIKNGGTQLLVNVCDSKNKDIIYTKTIPIVMDDIDSNAYIDHRAKAFKAKQYAFLRIESDIKTYTFEDSYTLKGPRIEGSYSGSSSGSAHLDGKYDSKYSGDYGHNSDSSRNDRDVRRNGSGNYSGRDRGEGSADASGRSSGSKVYSEQKSYTFNIGESAVYPIDRQCFINGALKEVNEENVYYEDAIEANKKQIFTFTFVGAEWDAFSQTQKRHKKYTKKCYIIPKPDETITMTVKFVYQKDKKGIFVNAKDSNNKMIKVTYLN